MGDPWNADNRVAPRLRSHARVAATSGDFYHARLTNPVPSRSGKRAAGGSRCLTKVSAREIPRDLAKIARDF
jgi:hypothetical protein